MRNLGQPTRPDPALGELEAALREDVRSLASPIDPDFHARLRERFARCPAARHEGGA